MYNKIIKAVEHAEKKVEKSLHDNVDHVACVVQTHDQ